MGNTVNSYQIIKSFLITFLFIFSLHAQNYHIKNYGKDDGLPQLQVFCIEQDSYGFMWFGTAGGLSRFDGQNFLTFGTPEGLSAFEVITIAEDSDHSLWIGTALGISKVNTGASIQLHVDSLKLLSDVRITDLCFAKSENTLWITTKDSGIYIYKQNTLKRIYLSESNPGFVFKEGNNVWSSDGRFLLNFNNSGKLLQKYELPGKETGIVRAISIDSSIIVITNTKLYRFKNNGFKIHEFQVPETVHINSALGDSKGNIWLGANNGLWKIGKNETIRITRDNGLCDDFVHYVFEDREGNIWVGSYTSGLSKIISTNVVSYGQKSGMDFTLGSCVLQDNKDRIFIGTEKGLYHYENDRLIKPAWSGKPGNEDT